MLRKFARHIILFFIPVFIGCVAIELLTRKLPMGYIPVSETLEAQKDEIEIMALGSSQMKDALNPEWLSRPGINLAAGNQHHNTDFKLYQGLKDRLPSLNTIIMELSYAHLEIAPNKSEFWKNNIYYEYYDVNCFERTAWAMDRLIYFSNPTYYSDALYKHFIVDSEQSNFNAFGFDKNNFDGLFSKLGYDPGKIAISNFKIISRKNDDLFRSNSTHLTEMLNQFEKDGIRVILVTTPTYFTYLEKRNPKILKRRDSMLTEIKKKFNNVTILDLEEDSLRFGEKDYINHNHLNPDGARKFTSEINKLLHN